MSSKYKHDFEKRFISTGNIKRLTKEINDAKSIKKLHDQADKDLSSVIKGRFGRGSKDYFDEDIHEKRVFRNNKFGRLK